MNDVPRSYTTHVYVEIYKISLDDKLSTIIHRFASVLLAKKSFLFI